MGSLLQEREGKLRFFHASLADWLKDPHRSGLHCVAETGVYNLADFLWADREFATRGLAINQDNFTTLWVQRSAWAKTLSMDGRSPRYWLNMTQKSAMELAITKNQLTRAVEYSRRLVGLASEAWGCAHEIFELAKIEWEELREQLQQVEKGRQIMQGRS